MTDHVTRYCTEMFRLYARIGGPQKYAEQMKIEREEEAEIVAYASGDYDTMGIKGGISDPTAKAYIKLARERKESGVWATYLDLLAVQKTLEIIGRLKNGREINKALQRVYLLDPEHELGYGEISDRIEEAGRWIPASEKSVSNWLRDARAILTRERGLRMDENQIDRLRKMHL